MTKVINKGMMLLMMLALVATIFVATPLTSNAAGSTLPSTATGKDISATADVTAELSQPGTVNSNSVQNLTLTIKGKVANVSNGDYILVETDNVNLGPANGLAVVDKNGDKIGTIYTSYIRRDQTLSNYDKYKDIYVSGGRVGESKAYIVFDELDKYGLKSAEFTIKSRSNSDTLLMDTDNNNFTATVSINGKIVDSYTTTYPRASTRSLDRNRQAGMLTSFRISNNDVRRMNTNLYVMAGANKAYKKGETVTYKLNSDSVVLFDYSNFTVGTKVRFNFNQSNQSNSPNASNYQKVSDNGVIFFGNYPSIYGTVVSISATEVKFEFDSDFPTDLSGEWTAQIGPEMTYTANYSLIDVENGVAQAKIGTYEFSDGSAGTFTQSVYIQASNSNSSAIPNTGTLSLYYTDELGNILQDSVTLRDYTDVALGTDYDVDKEEFVPKTIVKNGITYYYTSSDRDLKGKIEVQDLRIQNVYKAKQNALVTYKDETTGKTLETKDLTGFSGDPLDYKTDDTISKYENKGYELVSDDFPTGSAAVFDNDVYQGQSYTVVLKHKQGKTDPESKTIKRTIEYVYKDGGKAANAVTQQVEYTRTSNKDLVTGEIISHNPWTSKNDTFAAVKSPAINDHVVDVETVAALTVGADSSDIKVTVTYEPYQKAKVIYFDETANTELEAVDLKGLAGEKINYSTNDRVKYYEGLGYILVSDGYKNDSYDNDTSKTQTYRVVLKHGETIEGDTLERTVTRTIKYVYEDGKKASDDKTQSVKYTRNVTKDNVTGAVISYSNWSANGSETFSKVSSPSIKDYAPDRTEVSSVKVNADSGDITETVTYSPLQYATVKYVDKDKNDEVIKTVDLSGLSGAGLDYATEDEIKNFEDKGYVFVESDFPTGSDAVFDNDTSKNQAYTVVLKHGKKETEETKLVTRTIDYVYDNGQTAATSVVQEATFYRTVTEDLVTNEKTYSNWYEKDSVTALSVDFDQVTSPKIGGYSPDRNSVDGIKVSADTSDSVEVVTYKAIQNPNDINPDSGNKNNPLNGGGGNSMSSAKTGDNSNMIVFAVIMFVALAGFAVAALSRRRN